MQGGFAPGAIETDYNSFVDRAKIGYWEKGEAVRLTPTEYRLFEHLLRSAGRVVTHKELLEKVWGPEYADATGYLKSHIRSLREKLGDSARSDSAIVTEHGVGYRYVRTPSG